MKQAKINDENILLKLMFDKTGIAKDMIRELTRNEKFESGVWELTLSEIGYRRPVFGLIYLFPDLKF